LRRVCSFLSIDFDAAMVNYHARDSRSPIHTLLNVAPDAERIEAWQRELPAVEMREFDRRTAALLAAHDYPPLPQNLHRSTLRVIFEYQLARLRGRLMRRIIGLRRTAHRADN
jgi:hypothetical protein